MYPVRLLLRGPGGRQAVLRVFKALLSSHPMTFSGYGNPYQLSFGKAEVESLGEQRYAVTAEVTVRDLASAWVARQAFFLGAFRRDTDGFVAQVYIGVVSWEAAEFELGFFAGVDRQGQGYVTEAARAALGWAFTHLGAHRFRLECEDTNARSRAVAERCGMVREGHLRENKRQPDGSWSGTLLYGLLRREAGAAEQ